MEAFDLIVIGAGVSGVMAAVEAKSRGVNRVIVIDRDIEPWWSYAFMCSGRFLL